ncbi:MAG TPA: hypothetical protein DEF47_24985 [Herpetosiphon sp.]|uniref:Uncharacterized protein n=1 Tax=Herpetosiphon aurantiacus (strain ATCC 23779 / DSM 785 / 114-95) TaxID=316274 RepID=A9B721_HERA2|nr:hypothetical protein [Herpetosiphon sp.]ABX05889.1 hypothetical protein Haur_3252 [Herpetosiphon aurantiacus DSM 785]HBW53152.1 hypothetical protein [Herpetosiphon sp.]
MQAIRELTYPVRLSSAGLFALLSLVSAPTLLGAGVKSPYTLDEAQATALWEQGSNELRKHGWLIDDPTTHTSVINEDLLLLIISAVNAELVVLSTWQNDSGRKYDVAYYEHGHTVVEMQMLGSLYEFTVLSNRNVALQCFASHFEPAFPQAIKQPIQFQLTQEQALAAKQNPDVQLLHTFGVSEIAAHQFAATLQKPRLYGTIDILRTEATKVIESRIVGIILADTTAWIGFVTPDGLTDYHNVGEADFINLLDQAMSDLNEINVR